MAPISWISLLARSPGMAREALGRPPVAFQPLSMRRLAPRIGDSLRQWSLCVNVACVWRAALAGFQEGAHVVP